MEEMSKLIGPALRIIRKLHDVSTSEMSQRTGLSQSYLSELETGKKCPSFRNLTIYCQALNIQVSEAIAMAEVLSGNKDSARAFGPKMNAIFSLLEMTGSL